MRNQLAKDRPNALRKVNSALNVTTFTIEPASPQPSRKFDNVLCSQFVYDLLLLTKILLFRTEIDQTPHPTRTLLQRSQLTFSTKPTTRCRIWLIMITTAWNLHSPTKKNTRTTTAWKRWHRRRSPFGLTGSPSIIYWNHVIHIFCISDGPDSSFHVCSFALISFTSPTSHFTTRCENNTWSADKQS